MKKKVNKNLYEILGINPDATDQEIKEAYRKLAKTNHPDHGGSEDAIKDINHAYAVLKSPINRKQYDETGDDKGTRDSPVFNVILQLIEIIISDNPPDIAKFLYSVKEKWKLSHSEEVLRLKRRRDELSKFKKRILHKPDNDFIGLFLEDQIRLINKNIKDVDLDFNERMQAFDFFRNYEFSKEADNFIFQARMQSQQW
jgi:curved DNA-binding protein CbpA